MSTKKISSVIAAVLVAAAIALPAPAAAQSVAGLWDATVVVNQNEIPLRFEIAGAGARKSRRRAERSRTGRSR